MYDTAIFWSHAAAVNVETGLSAEGQGMDWWMNGVTITWGLLTKIATSHVGLGLMVAWLATLLYGGVQQYLAVLDLVFW